MIALDRFLIAQYERLGHWVQRWTGVNCLALAWFCLAGYVTICLLQIAFGEHAIGDWFAVGMMMFILLREYFRGEFTITAGFRNPREAEPFCRWIRLYAVAMVVFQQTLIALTLWLKIADLHTLLHSIRSILYLSWLYFEACTPLPPSEDRIKWKVMQQVTIEAKA